MKVDYRKIENAVHETVEHLRTGLKKPERSRKVSLTVVEDLEGIVTNGEAEFGIDAAIDAGGRGHFARPMDYVLGGLLGCQQMWCLRWAAGRRLRFADLQIRAEGQFTWRGEYLDEVDAGLTAINIDYLVTARDLTRDDVLDMADTVARRCPVFATLRKAVVIHERITLNGDEASYRSLLPAAR